MNPTEKTEKDDKRPSTEKNKFSLLRKPQISNYESLPALIELEETEIGQKDSPIPGFGEFRKYKQVNETRSITPYRGEAAREKKKKEDLKFPTIEIESADRFLIDKIKHIEVESLESLLNLIKMHPDVGFVTMNRNHMDLVNDYQPYKYTICNYNYIDKSNYVTISPNGITEFYKGDADFMPLERLLIEYKLFMALQKIPMFSKLRYWKAFMVWLQKIRRRKFMESRNKIEAFFAEKFQTQSSN